MDKDKEIISLLAVDKYQGFKLLFDRYYRPMCVFGTKYIRELFIVEDLVQDILLTIWDKGEYKKFNNLKSYLFTSVRNKCLSHLKKQSPDHIEELDYNWHSDLLIQEDDKELVEEKIRMAKKAISELPKGCQDVFNAVVISGLKYQEAADELSISINTVKSQMKKAYRLLDGKINLIVLLLIYNSQ